MSVRDVMQVLRKQLWVIALSTLVGIGLAAFASITATPVYTSVARVYFSLPSGNSGADLSQGSSYTQSQMLSYAALATQPIVLDAVLKDLGLGLTARELSQRVSAQANTDTVVLQLTARDDDPAMAAKIANSVSTNLVSTVVDLAPRDSDGKSTIDATIVAVAMEPNYPSSPNTRRNLLAGLVAGLGIGVFLALARTVLDTRVRSSADIEGLDLPVLGEIANRALRPADLTMVSDGRSPTAEAYRRIRTNLNFLSVDHKPLVVTITSSVAGEGKSTTSMNLALALAETHERVLLIEADLRRPTMSRYLDVDTAPGLTNILVGDATFDSVVQTPNSDGLFVLTSGDIPPNPSVLLGSEAMGVLLRELRHRFDVILLDAPPVLPVTDAAVLTPQTSGALIVVNCKGVHRQQVAASVEALHQVDGRVLGVVLQRVSKGSNEPGYHYVLERSSFRERISWWRRGSRIPASHGKRGKNAQSAALPPEDGRDERRSVDA